MTTATTDDDSDVPRPVGDQVTGDEATPPQTRSRSVLAIVAAVLVTALVVLLVVLVFFQRSRISDLEATADREADIASAAGEFAEVLLTYDHADLDASREAVTAMATDSFATQYRDAFEAGLGAQITELEATSKATVHEVLVNRSTGDTARVIVVADSEVRSAAGSEARVGSYIDLSLVRIDGAWLVDEVQSVANAAGGDTGSSAGAPTSSPEQPSPSSSVPG